MTGKEFRITAMIASAGLVLYYLYDIYSAVSLLIDPVKSAGTTIPYKLYHLFINYGFNWQVFALGICGFWFVYHDFCTAKGMDISRRALAVKKIIFSFLILFSILSFARESTSFFFTCRAYLIHVKQGYIQENMFLQFIYSIIGVLFMMLIDFGSILSGIYILSKKKILRKPAAAVYISGVLSSEILLISLLIERLFFYQPPGDYAHLLITKIESCQSVFSILRLIFILATCLVVILYGLHKNQTALKEKTENPNKCAADRTPQEIESGCNEKP